MSKANNEAKIVDFYEAMDSQLISDSKVWGKKNKPRAEEPSMYELMTWKDDEKEIWNYQSQNKQILHSDDLIRFKKKIKKSDTNWKSESHDVYRKFVYSPSKKSLFQEVDDSLKLKMSTVRPQSADPQKTTYKAVITEEGQIVPEEIYFEQLDKRFTSDYIDQYSIKNIHDEKELKKEIENNLNKNEKAKLKELENNGKKLVPKKIQFKNFLYDEKGKLIGKMDDYFHDVPNIIEDEEEEEEEEEYNEKDEGKYLTKSETKKKDEDFVKVEKSDYSNVKSKLLTSSKFVKKAKELDPVVDKVKLERRKQRIKKFAEQTKWLPNSSFTTYYGKPAFENYGRGNVNPTTGGLLYGNYLKSHNVNPHRGIHEPDFKQSYNNALMYGSRMPPSEPALPRHVTEDFRLGQEQVENLKNRSALQPEKNSKEKKIENLKIIKPDLLNSLRFASEENTPTNRSPSLRGIGKNQLEDLKKKQRSIRKQLMGSKKVSNNSKKTIKNETKAKEKENIKISTHDNKENITMTFGSPVQKEKMNENNEKKVKLLLETGTVVPQQLEAKSLPPKSAPEGIIRKKNKKNKKIEKLEEEFEKNNKIYPEHELKVSKKFMKSMKEKREFSRKIAPKVTEIYPMMSQSKNEMHPVKSVENKPKLIDFDEMKPPEGYMSSLSMKELNPKYYKHIPAVWLKRIPYAGKLKQKGDDIKLCFNDGIVY